MSHDKINILFNSNLKVEFAVFPVVAIVNDLGPSNVRLWETLGVSTQITCLFFFKSSNYRKGSLSLQMILIL